MVRWKKDDPVNSVLDEPLDYYFFALALVGVKHGIVPLVDHHIVIVGKPMVDAVDNFGMKRKSFRRDHTDGTSSPIADAAG